MEILNDLSDLENIWTLSAFNNAYSEPGLTSCALAVDSDYSGNLDKMSMITFRTFIENGECAKNDQKYILGIRFYSFGDMATIDIISLNKGYHKEIAYNHQKMMGWPSFKEFFNETVDPLKATYEAPFIFIGGHLKVDEFGKVNFFSSSDDYGNEALFSKGNSIAAYVAEACGLQVKNTDKTIGKAFIKDLLIFMRENKLKKDFYEILLSHIQRQGREAYKTFYWSTLSWAH